MKKEKLRGKDLAAIGYTETEIRSLAMLLVGKGYKYTSKAEKIAILKAVIKTPHNYIQDKIMGPVAIKLIDQQAKVATYTFTDKTFQIYGADGIAENAKSQMQQAMRLPVSVNGALMPDAHHGYGLPIGGVLATENAIIPYGVGVDIGCRMCLSIFDAKESYLEQNKSQLKKIIQNNSRFGRSTFEDNKREDAIFDRPEFREIGLIRSLLDKAYSQIGSSGGGNHFVEFGLVKINDINNDLNLPVGTYLALLTHSGSRGFGAKIANTYTNIAIKKRNLPKAVAHLSWLYMNEQEGQEYWLAMNLAGDYASACHHHIHRRVQKALGIKELRRIENHHNFAWKEQLKDGRSVYVHRKGATPAHQGQWGIIPGSMTAPAFIVRGLGNSASINSAAHGAGRAFSRRKAKESFTKKMLRNELKNKQVELIGAGLDEAPFAYKDIHTVMQAQQDLVQVVAPFYPKIVRMDSAKS
ncbi:RtcB family protein [Aureispira anguillae]|uniref:3'-phosphate/5'-hydroxy nucleic acid ligase n=1 Tax=Aureispira anguillae TaxID=2864201 RepID=A0A915YI88_9BACT|nr:RtcB family protein [Aureispira anguillae]BDS13682.1 RtcB family protein [Aureispira anguillae]